MKVIKWFFQLPMMSFAFLDMIFGGEGLGIDTYKPSKCIWSYHTHVVNTRWPKWSRRPKLTFLSNFDVKNSIKSSWYDNIFLNSCFQDWKWNKHHKFDTSSYVQMFENIQNILFTFFDIFSLILCYFWRQNCFKTTLLALCTTLVNTWGFPFLGGGRWFFS